MVWGSCDANMGQLVTGMTLLARERNHTSEYRRERVRRQTIAEGAFASLDRMGVGQIPPEGTVEGRLRRIHGIPSRTMSSKLCANWDGGPDLPVRPLQMAASLTWSQTIWSESHFLTSTNEDVSL